MELWMFLMAVPATIISTAALTAFVRRERENRSGSDPSRNAEVQRLAKQLTELSYELADSLAFAIIPALERIRENSGHPGDMTESEWHSYLSEMIAGFQAHLDIDELDPSSPDFDNDWGRLAMIRRKGLTSFAIHYQHLWT